MGGPIFEFWGNVRVYINPDLFGTASFVVEHGEPTSTCFLVSFGGCYYGVTTKHSVENLDVAIRLNLKLGGSEDKRILAQDWIIHRDTDVAVVPLDFLFDEREKYAVEFISDGDFKAYSDHYKWGDEFPADYPHPMRFDAGDEVFSIGLFDRHHGGSRTRPVVRFGHVALVPGLNDRISAEIYPEPHHLIPIDAFLVEIAAWPGQSGSPVFLRPYVVNQERRTRRRPSSEKNFLIGMIQGFYPGEQDVQINDVNAKLSLLNMGISIVVPAKDIRGLLMRPDVKSRRDDIVRERYERMLRTSAASDST